MFQYSACIIGNHNAYSTIVLGVSFSVGSVPESNVIRVWCGAPSQHRIYYWALHRNARAAD